MLNPRGVGFNEEQLEFLDRRQDGMHKQHCQYDYRDTGGGLFSCVKTAREDCRNARNAWCKNRREAMA